MFSSSCGSHGHKEFHLLTKQDDTFFSRLLSKEKSKGEDSSLRFYYRGGCSGSIPFHWESQPGTPKHALADSRIFNNSNSNSNSNNNPPLTPPPSFHTSRSLQNQSSSSSKLIKLFPASVFTGKIISRASPPPSPAAGGCNGRRHRRARSDFLFQIENSCGDDHPEAPTAAGDFPTSPLCFGGGGWSRRSKGGFGRFYRVKSMKRALLSVVGYGSSA